MGIRGDQVQRSLQENIRQRACYIEQLMVDAGLSHHDIAASASGALPGPVAVEGTQRMDALVTTASPQAPAAPPQARLPPAGLLRASSPHDLCL